MSQTLKTRILGTHAHSQRMQVRDDPFHADQTTSIAMRSCQPWLTATSSPSPLALLDSLLASPDPAIKSILIVPGSRADFLASLTHRADSPLDVLSPERADGVGSFPSSLLMSGYTQPQRRRRCEAQETGIRPGEEDGEADGEEELEAAKLPQNAVYASSLIPTLHNIARSQNVQLVFVRSAGHLRAYLASRHMAFVSQREIMTQEGSSARLDAGNSHGTREQLILLNVLALHRGTYDNSAQGLSRTLGAAVDIALAARAAGRGYGVQLVECGDDRSWDERIPVLGGAFLGDDAGEHGDFGGHALGGGGGDSTISRKTVDVRRVVGRHFTILPVP